ncbi:MAG: glycosyltransferase family 2 protein [Actinobacteria bacterium]|nr:glycosyltransferase family 2 protein [Actinomycetota bacterium]
MMDAPPSASSAVDGSGPVEDAQLVGVPPVVAVVVTHDAGPWLEETLSAVGAQDYPNLSVLVVDAASSVDPTPRIAGILPSAYVRRLEVNRGFGASANDVLGVVEGASHYVFLHDDAAPEPDAVRLLVEEAFRSNAGVVSPKLVDWADPRRLLAVGAAADKTGAVTPYGRDDLDQEQHDAVRDVFVAPGGCTLVRTDLFETLEGFDPELALFGEDLDLSWRAQVLGARVVVAPAARVRHREATVAGERPIELGGLAGAPGDQVGRLQLRHRLRSVLKAYGPLHLLRVFPQLAVVMLGQAALALVSGRPRTAAAVVDAWRWNLDHWSELRAARRALHRRRALRDREVRRLQTKGRAWLSSALRGRLAGEEYATGMGAAGRRMADAVTAGALRQNLIVWLGLIAVLVIGSRDLLGGPLPAVGQLVPFPDSPWDFLRSFLSGWRTSGLGGEAPAPPAFALLGLAGALLGGAMGLLQKILVLGAIPAGIVGAYRLASPVASWRARLLGAVLYAAVPLPYDALARGRWSGLLAYAAAPWLLARLLRATGLAPFGAPTAVEDQPVVRRAVARPPGTSPADAVEDLLGAEAGTIDPIATEEFRVAAVALAGRPDDHGDERASAAAIPAQPRGATRPGTLAHQAVASGVLLALVGAFVPSFLAAVVLMGAALVAGAALVGDLRPMLRALAVAGGAALTAAVLLLPWTLEVVLPGATWAGFAGLGEPASVAPKLGQLLRFDTGPVGGGPAGWGILVVAALALVLGRRWRFGWAARLWVVAAVLWGISWALGRGWLGLPPPPPDVLLAPAAAALVLAAVLGVVAFETDLRGYQFGLRQMAFGIAAVAAVSTTLPVVGAALDGRWKAPESDFADLLSWMPERRADGAFRVLWAGSPEVLPLDGWSLGAGLAYGTSRGGPGDARVLWPASDQGATGLVADALQVARRGETSRLGHLLAPMGIRYLAVPLDAAPAPPGASARPRREPEDLLAALRGQIDLKLISGGPGDSLIVYENAAWAPARSVLPPDAIAGSQQSGLEAARTTELAGATPVLVERSPTRFSGSWPGGDLLFAEAYSPRWRFHVGSSGDPQHRKAFGWANAYTAGAAAEASLRYHTSPLHYGGIVLQLGLWAAAVRAVVRGVRSRRASDTTAPQPTPPAP